MTHVSAVIGFKDWGLERLQLCIESVHNSLTDYNHEIVVVDYGSADPGAIVDLATSQQAIYDRPSTDGKWSAARARNAGVRAASGDIILAIDADMIFTPSALSRVVSELERSQNQIVILQCRDLPHGFSAATVKRDAHDWNLYGQVATLRPRWGNGGLVGVHRSKWERIRGWDERMHTYGGEDLDFALRAQRSGLRINWLDEASVRMFHIWHPSSALAAQHSHDATVAVEKNREILASDKTWIRNRVQQTYLPAELVPTVSVVLRMGGEESEEETARTAASVLGQTMQALELHVIGATEDLRDIDERLHVHKDARGIELRGTYTAVARIGDIWSASRLEKMLDATDQDTGILVDGLVPITLPEDTGSATTPVYFPFDEGSSLVRTLLLPHETIHQALRNPSLAAGLSGAGWKALPEALRYRRRRGSPSEDETRRESTRRDKAGRLTMTQAGLAVPDAPSFPREQVHVANVGPELLDSFHSISFSGKPQAVSSVIDDIRENEELILKRLEIADLSGEALWSSATCSGPRILPLLRLMGTANRNDLKPSWGIDAADRYMEFVLGLKHLDQIYGESKAAWWLIALADNADQARSGEVALRTLPGLSVVLGRELRHGDVKEYAVFARTLAKDPAEALVAVQELKGFHLNLRLRWSDAGVSV